MPITVSATEAKVRLGAIIEWAVRESDDVVIQSRGRPTAVLISYRKYEDIRQLRERARRREALERLEVLAERLRVRGQSLPPEQADQLAQQFSREVIDDLIAEGTIRYRA